VTWLLVGLMLVALVAVVAIRVRARRRRAEVDGRIGASFQAWAEGLDGVEVETADDGWRITTTGASRYRIPIRDVLAAARRAERAGERAPNERWSVLLARLEAPLPPLDGTFHLKAHGPRVLPRLCHPELFHWLPAEPRPAWRPSALSPLGTLYLLVEDGLPGRLISEEALREAGVDGRDLDGIALAVLRQRFEEETLPRALAGELVELCPADGCGASRALVAGDFLEVGQHLVACVPSPDRLLLTSPEAASSLLELAGRRDARREPLSRRLLEIDARGPRWAEVS